MGEIEDIERRAMNYRGSKGKEGERCPILFQIIARRWFDKINGNTYHSVEVYVNNQIIGSEDYTYGYGEQYLQTAHEILMDKGYFPKTDDNKEDYYKFMQFRREHPERFLISVTDMARKKDL